MSCYIAQVRQKPLLSTAMPRECGIVTSYIAAPKLFALGEAAVGLQYNTSLQPRGGRWARLSGAPAREAELQAVIPSDVANSVGEGSQTMEETPYTPAELLIAGDGFPERGPLCHHCNTRVPQFAEFSEADEQRVRWLIGQGRHGMAMAELQAVTGCPPRFAKIWVMHGGRAKPLEEGTLPCPYCGKPLRTSLSKQCRFCRRDWHDPQHLRFMG